MHQLIEQFLASWGHRRPGMAGELHAIVDAAIQQALACQTHPHVILRCLACAGSKGGKVRSPKKAWHARENIRVVNAQRTPNPKKKKGTK